MSFVVIFVVCGGGDFFVCLFVVVVVVFCFVNIMKSSVVGLSCIVSYSAALQTFRW